MFKWLNEEEILEKVYQAFKINERYDKDYIQWAFDELSNREAEGFEEAWESLMEKAVEKAKEKERMVKEDLSKLFHEMHELTGNSLELLVQNASKIPLGDYENIIRRIRSMTLSASVFERKRKIVEKWARPDWIRRVLRSEK